MERNVKNRTIAYSEFISKNAKVFLQGIKNDSEENSLLQILVDLSRFTK